jgi:hypothetical protein
MPFFPAWSGATAIGLVVNDATPENSDLLLSFPRARCICFESSHVPAAWLAKLRELPELEFLHFCGTDFSDEGFSALVSCKRLKYVCVHQTRITVPGLAAFEKQRPNVKLNAWFH